MKNQNQAGIGQKSIIFVLLLIAASFVSFILGNTFEKNKASKNDSILKNMAQVSSPKKDNSISMPALIDANGPKKGLILSTNISQVFRGTLTGFTTNSWTIKYGQETLTITQQVPDQKISFFATLRKTNKTDPIKANELKIGDYVNIITQYLPKEEKMAVTSITAYRE